MEADDCSSNVAVVQLFDKAAQIWPREINQHQMTKHTLCETGLTVFLCTYDANAKCIMDYNIIVIRIYSVSIL